jgi:hypothetical protein
MKTLRAILSVLAGVVLGSFVNGGLISLSPYLIPPPQGVDVKTMEGLLAGLPLFEPKHFLMPFLAHALGTLFGAVVSASIAKENKLLMALICSVLFLIGGSINVYMLPAPIWFNVLDLAMAYLPMGYLGYLLSVRLFPAKA